MIFREGQVDGSRWAIWEITETKEQLVSMIENKAMLDEILSMKSEPKMLERLAVRVLLKHLAGEELRISYHSTGRPYLKDRHFNISISHTRGYVAVALSPLRYVGIDIQSVSEKVKAVRRRFVSDTEYIDPRNELTHLLLHWSAKETLYKALGEGGIDFANQFTVAPFDIEAQGICSATEKVTPAYIEFDVHYFCHEHFVFTYLLK